MLTYAEGVPGAYVKPEFSFPTTDMSLIFLTFSRYRTFVLSPLSSFPLFSSPFCLALPLALILISAVIQYILLSVFAFNKSLLVNEVS